MFRRFQGSCIHRKWVRIANNPAVLDPDNAVGIFFRQFRVVGDHHHKAVLGNLLQQLHDLHAGFRVQRAGGFVSQQNIRVIDQRTGNGHTLHLAAGHLVGLLMKLIAQAHSFQRAGSPAAALLLGDAGDGQRQLNVGQNGLVGNQVVALEHKTDGVVAVGIPVPVRIFFRGDAVNHQIAAVIPIQTADHVQQRGLAGAAGAQNRHELIVPEVQAHTGQCRLNQFAGHIGFFDVHDLQHRRSLLNSCICNQFTMILMVLQDNMSNCFN